MPKGIDFRRQALRAAARIHEHLLGPARLAPLPMLPRATWQEVADHVRRYGWCRSRGWQAAGRSLQGGLSYSVRRLIRELEEFHSQLPAADRERRIAAPRDIAADLEALPREFAEVVINLQERTITVATDPVRLEEVYLGPFEIELRWEWIGQTHPYHTCALEPHRPSHDDEVTHPHVRKDLLCEGDGMAAIKAALLEGRLLDFFSLVRQILGTYNEASAYVTLDRWSGVSCIDCGCSMDPEEHGICERCDEGLCGECSTLCSECDRYVCGGCLCECNGCGERYCRSCLTDGPESTLFCKSCLENKENPDDESQERPEQEEPAGVPEPDSVCVGQAAVPA